VFWSVWESYFSVVAYQSISPLATARNLSPLDIKTLSIVPGSPWENGYIESFNGKLRDELLDREIFDTLWEAKVLVACWRREYNQIRQHGSLGYKPPAPEAFAASGLSSEATHLRRCDA
jgi:Integrase core domain